MQQIDSMAPLGAYKVVAVGRPRDQKGDVVEIYDSTYRSWGIAGTMPEDLWVVRPHMGMTLLFCDDIFYCLIISGISGWWVIMGFNQKWDFHFCTLARASQEKTHVPLPAHLWVAGSSHKWEGQRRRGAFARGYFMGFSHVPLPAHLWVAGSSYRWEGQRRRGAFARGYFMGFSKGEGRLLYFFILMLERGSQNASVSSSSCWKEVARMPPSLCEDVNRTLYNIHNKYLLQMLQQKK